MPSINISNLITSVEQYSIQTNYGVAHGTIYNVNITFTLGGGYATGLNRMPPFNLSVVAHTASNGTVTYVPFVSSGSRVTCVIRNNGRPGLNYYKENGTYIPTVTVTATNSVVPLPILLRDNVGKVCYYTGFTGSPYFQTTSSGVTLNTASSFGTFQRADFTPSVSVYTEYNQTNIDIAMAILSSLYIPPPFSPGGYSESEIGGTGDYDDTSDPIDFPPLPALSSLTTNFVHLYTPSPSQLIDFAAFLWDGNLFNVGNWQKILNDPMDGIISLSILPVPSSTNTPTNIVYGNMEPVVIDTSGGEPIQRRITMPPVSNQFIDIDCGSIDVTEFWGAYLDYAPHTKLEIFLPYIGTRALDADNTMGKTVIVRYRVDMLTGSCVAMIKCGDSVLYSFPGQCSVQIPVTGKDYSQIIQSVMEVATSLSMMGVTGGMTAPMGIPTQSRSSYVAYRQGEAAVNVGGAGASLAVNALKPDIQKSGVMSSSAGFLGLQKPYLIITRPRQALPENQEKYVGYPSYVYMRLAVLEGYTQVEQIHLKGVSATDAEIDEILSLLHSGVII